jgi:3D (Asp-Asp-Asp) domain-containing protein
METNDWGNAIVVDPRELQRLQDDVRKLTVNRRWLRGGLALAVVATTISTASVWGYSERLTATAREARVARVRAARSGEALAALSRSHDRILAATERAPSVGTSSWGRRFTVTKYLPNDPAYGKDNDGLTATLVKADPAARIVAVDPKLIPYKSWVWIEDLGWYRAEDCGSAIKGFRLDLLTATAADAKAFGRQDRFVIVVPPGGDKDAVHNAMNAFGPSNGEKS